MKLPHVLPTSLRTLASPIAAFALLASFLGSCGGGGGDAPPAVVPSSSLSSVTPSSSTAVADGTAQITFTVEVLDGAGNPMPDREVTLSSSGSDNTWSLPALTDAAGLTTATLSSIRAESKTIQVEVGTGAAAVALDSEPTVQFLPDVANISSTLSTIAATPAGGLIADGSASAALAVTVRDANGNVVPGQTVQLAASGSNNTLTQPSGVTSGAGQASGAIASTTAEVKTVGATINPGPSQVVLSTPAQVEFLGNLNDISAALSTVSVTPSSGVVADGTATATIEVTVVDGGGNPLAGQTVQLAATGTGNTLTQPAAVTDAFGVATGTIAALIAETKSVTATINPGVDDVLLFDTGAVAFVGDPATIDAALSGATATPATGIVADGAATTVVDVVVRDANGNVVPGQTVQIAADGTNNTITQPASSTDVLGEASGSLATIAAELKTFTITVNPGPSQVVLTTQPTAAFIGDASAIDADLSSVTASPSSSVVADGSTTSSVTITVRDENGNPVPDQAVTFSSTGSSNTLVQPAAVTDANGVATGTIATTLAESKTISAIVDPGGAAVALTDEPVVAFIADAGNVSAVLSSFDATPAARVSANGVEAIGLTAVIVDGNGNPLVGKPVEFRSTGDGTSVTPNPATTDASGTATAQLTSTIAERKRLTAVVDPGAGEVALNDEEQVSFIYCPGHKRYVRTTGSDSNGGTSPNDAWRTLAHAALNVTAGTTVHVGAGTYSGSFTLSVDGTLEEPICFEADESGEHTGDAGSVILDGGGAADVVVVVADYVAVDGFVIRGADPAGAEGAGIRVGDLATVGVKLRKNRIYGNRRGIHAYNADELVIEHNVISNNTTGGASGFLGLGPGGEGIYLHAVADSTVLNNLIYNNEHTGCRLTGATTGVTVQANTLYYNGDHQIHVGGLLNMVVVKDNVVSEGFNAGIVLSLGSLLTSSYNDSWGHVGLDFLGLLLGLGDISVDPLLENPFGVDATLGGLAGDDDEFFLDVSIGSPAIDGGSDDADLVICSDGTTLGDRTTRFDGLLDGEGVDLDALNIGYHYPAVVDALTELDEGFARCHYAELSAKQTRARVKHGLAWLTAQLLPPTGKPVRWVCHELSLVDDLTEFALVQAETGTGTELSCLRWNGTSWHEDWVAPCVDAVDASARAAVLVTLEAGNALAVWCDGTNSPKYREFISGVWSEVKPVLTTPPGTADCVWIGLEASADGDEATLCFVDEDADLFAVTWKAGAWDEGALTTLEVDLRAIDTQCFDLAYEASTGAVLCAWAGPAGEARFATRAGGGSVWSSAAVIPGIGTTPVTIDLCSDGATDWIAYGGLCDVAADAELKVVTWDGSAWVDAAVLDAGVGATQGAIAGDLGVAVGWCPVSNEAIVAYADTVSGFLHWGSWTAGGGWTLNADASIAGLGTIQSVRLERGEDGGGTFALVSDGTDQLFAVSYDGASWTLDSLLTAELSTGSGVAFDLVVER